MKELEKYTIGIYGLENRRYEFRYDLGADFFAALDQDLIESGEFAVTVELEKSSTMLQLWFFIKGRAGVVCDRSLEPFEEPLEIREKLILKFGDRDEELTEEIALINRHTTQINVAVYIYEFIALALPMKKIHPDLRREDESGDRSAPLVYNSEEPEADRADKVPDPRWEVLSKLKSN